MTTEPMFRLVCGLYEQHPHHIFHSRPCDSYTEAVDLAAALDNQATPDIDSLGATCTPYKVQRSVQAWQDVTSR